MEDDDLFLAVVDGGSFRAAAKSAGLDPSRVSRRVAALEKRVGVKLLNRTTRALSSTEAGARYAEGIRRLAQSRAALLAEVTGELDAPTGRLRVAAPTDFGARYVAPVLLEMSVLYRDLDIDLRLGSDFTDLLAERIDVAVRIGELGDSGLIARRIGMSRRVLVAAPQLASTVTYPEDLSQLQAVSYRNGVRFLRAIFEINGQHYDEQMPCRFRVNSMAAVREVVLAGRAAHLGPEWAFADDIMQKRVVEVLPGALFAPFPIHALWLPTPFQPAAQRHFISAISKALTTEGLS